VRAGETKKTTPTATGGRVPLVVNARDGSSEGIARRLQPWSSVQSLPEACCKPTDVVFLLPHFIAASSSLPSNIATCGYHDIRLLPYG